MKAQTTITSYTKELLRERYCEYCNNSTDGQGDGMGFAEYVAREAENDPYFFDFLFHNAANGIEEVTAEQRVTFYEYLDSIGQFKCKNDLSNLELYQ